MMNDNNYLIHYGILGMKWGVRRYQYKDGTLTPAGRRRYAGDRVIASGDRYEITVPRRAKLTEDDMRKLVNFIDMNRHLDDASSDQTREQHRQERREDRNQRRQERREDRNQRRQEHREDQRKQVDTKKGKDSVDAIINRVGNLIKVGTSALALYKGYQEFKKIRGENDEARQAVNDAQRTAREAAREAARVTYDNNDITRYATLALPSGSKRRRRQ